MRGRVLSTQAGALAEAPEASRGVAVDCVNWLAAAPMTKPSCFFPCVAPQSTPSILPSTPPTPASLAPPSPPSLSPSFPPSPFLLARPASTPLSTLRFSGNPPFYRPSSQTRSFEPSSPLFVLGTVSAATNRQLPAGVARRPPSSAAHRRCYRSILHHSPTIATSSNRPL